MKKLFLLTVVTFVLAGTIYAVNHNQEISNKKIEVSGAKIAPEKFELSQKQRLMVIVFICIVTGIALAMPDKNKKDEDE